MFRVSCFTTTPYSQLMWAMYANKHKGFCVEYDIKHQNKEYEELFLNLFPVIYSLNRSNTASRIIGEKDDGYSYEHITEIFKIGLLRKSIDWAFQNEWRLILPTSQWSKEDKYLFPFYPISRVYLGSRMPEDSRVEIIDICEKHHIQYIDVVPNEKVFLMTEKK